MGHALTNAQFTPPRPRQAADDQFPSDRGIEAAFIGAALAHTDACEALAERPPEHIWDIRLRHLRDAIVTVHEAGGYVDRALVNARLREAGVADFVPDSLLGECRVAAGNGLGWEQHNVELDELYRRRIAIRHAAAIAEAARIGSWGRYAELVERPPASAPGRQPLAVTPVHVLLAHPPERRPILLDGLLRQGELMVVVAEASVGKSWWCMQMALHLAEGHGEFLGFGIRRECRVLYAHQEMDAEGAYDRWRILIGEDGTIPPRIDDCYDQITLGVIEEQLQEGPRRTRRLIPAGYEELEARIAADRPDVCFIDTWGAVYDANENDKQATNAVAKQLARIAATYGCAIVVVHHYRKLGTSDAGRGDPFEAARGSSRLIDAAHTRLVISPHYTAKAAKERGLDEESARQFAEVRVRRRVGRKPAPFHMRFDPGTCRWDLWEPEDDEPIQGDAKAKLPSAIESDRWVRVDRVIDVARAMGGVIPSVNAFMAEVNKGITSKQHAWGYDKCGRALRDAAAAGAVECQTGDRTAKSWRLP